VVAGPGHTPSPVTTLQKNPCVLMNPIIRDEQKYQAEKAEKNWTNPMISYKKWNKKLSLMG